MNIDKSLKKILNTKNTKFMFPKNNFNFNSMFSNKIVNKALPQRMFRKNDWDMDGVINRKDCQPFNVMRQDASKKQYQQWLAQNKTSGLAKQVSKQLFKTFLTTNKPLMTTQYFDVDEEGKDAEIHNIKIRTLKKHYSTLERDYKYETVQGRIGTSREVIFYKPGEKERAEELQLQLLSKKTDIGKKDIRFNYDFHTKQGIVLGYTKAEIDEFNSKVKQQEWSEMSEQQRNKQRQIKKDTDGDRVPDGYDCQPFNVMRQHARPNILQREKIYNQPIFIYKGPKRKTGVDILKHKGKIVAPQYNPNFAHISEVPVKSETSLFSQFKRHPHLVGEIEKHEAFVLYADTDKVEDAKITDARTLKEGFVDKEGKTIATIILATPKYPKTIKEKQKTFKYGKDYRAGVMFHELKHSEQFVGRDKDKLHEQLLKEKELPWEDRPTEIEAEKYAQEQLDKRLSQQKQGLWLKTEKAQKEQDYTYLDKMYKEKEPVELNEQRSAEAFRHTIGASPQKQQEWQNMTENQKTINRKVRIDSDGDNVPDQYDCEPNNAEKQDVERKTIPHWLFKQLNSQQQKEAQHMIFVQGSDAGTVAEYFNVVNPFKVVKRPLIFTTRVQKIFILQELGRELGRVPMATDLKNYLQYPSSGAFSREFGSWNNALITAGFIPTKEHKQKIIASELVKEKGYVPVYRERAEIYRYQPEIKDRAKQYYKKRYESPEFREIMKKQRKKYEQQPEVKERIKKYEQQPEIKERRKKYIKEYEQRSEVKEKRKQYDKERRRR